MQNAFSDEMKKNVGEISFFYASKSNQPSKGHTIASLYFTKNSHDHEVAAWL